MNELIRKENIKTNLKAADWKDAIRLAGKLLEESGSITSEYIENMIKSVETLGPYIVIIPGLALGHAEPCPAVLKNDVSIITLENEVNFNSVNDPVRVVMCLACVDKESHIENLQKIALRLMIDDAVEKILECKTADELYNFINEKEQGDDSMLFGYSHEQLKEKDGIFTASEIAQQASTWTKTLEQVKNIRKELKEFVDLTVTKDDFDVILTGAGTSEFVGNSIFSYLNRKLNYKCKSFGTTDIVQTPRNFLSATKPTLLVSYGRSGNSPESMAAINVANKVCQNIKHLIITCNPNGAMSVDGKKDPNAFVIDLTEETHDKSFAMTSSYSNMYLASLLALTIDELEENEKVIKEVIAAGQRFVDKGYESLLPLISDFQYQRIVYLGGNTLKGVAQESALKTLELCAGKVVTMFDTPMGFRHGPKSIINPETLVVVYLSDNPYQRQYEMDIISEMSKERNGNKILAVSSYNDETVKELVDYFYSFDLENRHDNVFLGLDYIEVAQWLGLFKSLHIGNTPDNPCSTGTVNRVVKGVTIYDFND